jgi:hypothetical protein
VNLKKRAALVMFLFLLGAVGAQSQKAAPSQPPADPPSAAPIPALSDTMSWISAHFEKSSQTLSITYTAEAPMTDGQRQFLQAGGDPIPTVDLALTVVTTQTYSVLRFGTPDVPRARNPLN